MTAREPAIKGLAFREFVHWYERTRGEAAMTRAFEAMAPALERAGLVRERECFGILPGSWYPVSIATGLLEHIATGHGIEERNAVLREGARHTLEVTLRGVYRVLFQKLMTPERHAQYTQKIWSNFYNTGTVTGRVVEEGRAEQTVTDWAGHHPLLCELSIWTLTTMYEMMELRSVRVRRTSCAYAATPAGRRPASAESAEPPACRYLITWDVTSAATRGNRR